MEGIRAGLHGDGNTLGLFAVQASGRTGIPLSQDGADTFVRFVSSGESIDVPIARLGICGFGRSASNTVVLADGMTSREHAMIRRNATGLCMLSDLGSTNGTR